MKNIFLKNLTKIGLFIVIILISLLFSTSNIFYEYILLSLSIIILLKILQYSSINNK